MASADIGVSTIVGGVIKPRMAIPWEPYTSIRDRDGESAETELAGEPRGQSGTGVYPNHFHG
jgi:hypothetical protein